MLLSYLAASISSAIVVIIAGNLLETQFHPSLGPVFHLTPSVILGVPLFTIIFAFPGWLLSVLYAEHRRETRIVWFATTGILTSILALSLLSASLNGYLPLATFVGPIGLSACLGGLVGGLVYWSMAGKSSGERNQSTIILAEADENAGA
jgi:uncharacterized membrane protein HdeD (DUF308 family)